MKKTCYILLPLFFIVTLLASAQERLPVRAYTAPEELISMDAVTTFDQAMDIFNNASKRFRNKPLLNESSSTDQIGVNITHMHWQDAFELVLRINGHWYTETEDFIRVTELQTRGAGGGKATDPLEVAEALVSREVQIAAVFFEANRSELERLGLDWFLTNTTPSSQVGFEVSTTGTTSFHANDQGEEGQTEIELGNITTLAIGNGTAELLAALKALQSENLGELISSPNITVRSGEKGRIQVGQDISIKQRDFSGNTVERFFSTGTIIEVTPTVLIQDSLEFVKLDITAERSSFQPDPVSTVINKTVASTSVILIDQEETVVGGLVTNEAKIIRRGVPFLKDLPWWVFGLRYLFGYEEVSVDKKELIIILRADIVPPIDKRVERRVAEIRSGQNALQRESERLDELRRGLLRQIEAAKQNRSD
ncbi:MAG: type II and III secretion system protein [Bacteroidetes bacterium]|nr:type II and III secretion system protein [Bacteroidota bacterium]